MADDAQSQRVKQQWEVILEEILAAHRRQFPDDARDDRTLLNNFMEFCVSEGLVKKHDGKFHIPEIVLRAQATEV